MTFSLVPFGLRKLPQIEPDVFLRQVQKKAAEGPKPAGPGWTDAPAITAGVVVIRVPGLPDDNGRVEWNDHEVQYSRGRNLAGYLRELGLEDKHVLHVIIDGAIYRRQDTIRVLLPEKPLARIWRELRNVAPPAIELGAFDAYIPRQGTVISIVPTVDGKNTSLILGIVGAIIAIAATGGAATPYVLASHALLGYAIGSTVGALVAPTPNRVKDKDGPNSYQWGGITNDDRAGVPEEILLGQRLVAGGRISAFRRRATYVSPNRAGSIVIIQVTNSGSGYTSPPTVTIGPPGGGGVQATATASIGGTQVSFVTIVNAGSGYSATTPPAVTFSGGSGGGATAVAVVAFDPAPAGDQLYDSQAPHAVSETLHMLVRIAGHQTEGPVGIVNPNIPADVSNPSAPANAPDVRINGQHYLNFPGVAVEWRTGASPQTVIPGFDVVANSLDVNVDVTALGPGVPYIYTTLSNQVDAFEVLIVIAGLSRVTNAGVQSNKTRYTLEYKRHGSTDPWINIDAASPGQWREVSGQVRISVPETRRIQNLTRAQYDIRVTWIGADFVTANDQYHVIISAVTEETQQAVSYDGKTILAIKGVATEQLNGGMPTVTAVWRGAQPQKWDGTQWLAPDWGAGTSTPAGRNRGWLTAWLLRNRELGTGAELPDQAIDGNSIKAYADQCDQIEVIETVNGTCTGGSTTTVVNLSTPVTVTGSLKCALRVTHADGTVERSIITDAPGTYSTVHLQTAFTAAPANGETFGFGLWEPRHQCDAYINQQQPAIDALTQLLGSSRACPIFSGNLVKLGYNGVTTPTQLFGMGNIVQGSMKLQYQSKRHEINTYDVTFDDEAADFDTETVTVCIKSDGTFTDEAGLQAAGEVVRRRSLQLIGTRRRTEAVREGRFQLKNDYAVRTVGGFTANTDSMFAEVYDVINVSHDLPQWGYSGRVMPNDNAPASIIQSMVLFDRAVPFDGVTQYGVIIRYAAGDGSGNELIEERIVADVAAPDDGSSYFGVTVTVPFTRVPAEGDVYAYGPVPTKVKPFRMIDISLDVNIQRAITIVEYNKSIHDTSGPIVIPVFSDLPTFGAPPAPITDAKSYIESKLNTDGVNVRSIIVEWAAPKPAKQYGFFKGAKIEYGYNVAGPWTALQSIDGTMFRWDNPPIGVDIFFRLTSYSTAGRYNFAGAYVISTPVHLTANWSRDIAPVDPSAVTLSKDATSNANRHRAVVSNPIQPTQSQIFDLFLNWTFSDSVNPTGSLVGFEGIVYRATGGTPDAPYWTSGVVANPGQRTLGIPGLAVIDADSYIGAVRAVYLDGKSSNLVTSSGLVLDPNTHEPALQTSDDRNVAAYAETFDSGSVPVGFSKAPLDGIFVTLSTLGVNVGSVANTWIQWDLKAWATAYLDSQRNSLGLGIGKGFAVLVSFDPQGALNFASSAPVLNVTYDDGLGNITTRTAPIPVDGNVAHIFRIDFNDKQLNIANSPKITIDASNVFATTPAQWNIRGIAVALDDVSWNVDGHLDRAIHARDQFGKDPTGGGFFLGSPVRNADATGGITLVESNGLFYLRGDGVTETGYRRGKKARANRIFNGAFVNWNILSDSTFSNGGTDPVLPVPLASSKARVLLDVVDGYTLESNGLTPVRRYIEATEIGVTGFRIASFVFYGGTLRVYRDVAPAGGWATAVGNKSAMTQDALVSPFTLTGNDAWYNFQSRGLSTFGITYYRSVLWIEVAMPLIKKQNGNYYYVDVWLYAFRGKSNNDNPMTFAGAILTGPYSFRVYTDGQTWRMPIVMANASGGSSLITSDAKVDWFATNFEGGNSTGPNSVRLMAVELHYQDQGAGNSSITDQNLDVIYVEEA